MLTLRLVCPVCGAKRSVKLRAAKSQPRWVPAIERWDCQECGAAYLRLGRLVTRYPETLARRCRRFAYHLFSACLSGGLLYLILSSFLTISDQRFVLLISLLWGVVFILARSLLR